MQEQRSNLNSPTSTKEIEFIDFFSPERDLQTQMDILVNSIKHLRMKNANSTQTLPENEVEQIFLTYHHHHGNKKKASNEKNYRPVSHMNIVLMNNNKKILAN